MSFEDWKRSVPPKEQAERDRKRRNSQLAHQYAITESFMERLLGSSGPIEQWERDFLNELIAGNSYHRYEANQRLLRA